MFPTAYFYFDIKWPKEVKEVFNFHKNNLVQNNFYQYLMNFFGKYKPWHGQIPILEIIINYNIN